VVWGGVVRSREKQSNVDYPIEMDDELIDDKGLIDTSLSSAGLGTSLNHVPGAPTECWLSGWNFITDLYRVLEHALARFRSHRNRRRRNSFLREIFDDQPMATEESVRDSVLKMYISLPSCFKETPEMTFNVRKDRFGFQAANITASLQLVRMVLFAADGASIAERCQIASDVVKAFASIPVSYLLAICMPLLHHLGGIGVILGSVLGEPLNQTDYNHVRSIMLSMAQLLEDLEAIHQSSSASEKLRSQVARIDEYMQSERLEIPARHPGPTDESSIVQPWMADHNDSINAAENHDQDEARAWSFQIPPDLLDELNWSFDFNQSVDLLER
jgi:hypothetical protein